jgi:hypothetical protein
MDLARQIELHLLDRAEWVSVQDLCTRFAIRPRMLRADGDRDGLLDNFAVSSTRGNQHGFIHINLLSSDDYIRAKRRLRKHGIRELRKVRRWEQARARARIGLKPTIERHTGQLLLIP